MRCSIAALVVALPVSGAAVPTPVVNLSEAVPVVRHDIVVTANLPERAKPRSATITGPDGRTRPFTPARHTDSRQVFYSFIWRPLSTGFHTLRVAWGPRSQESIEKKVPVVRTRLYLGFYASGYTREVYDNIEYLNVLAPVWGGSAYADDVYKGDPAAFARECKWWRDRGVRALPEGIGWPVWPAGRKVSEEKDPARVFADQWIGPATHGADGISIDELGFNVQNPPEAACAEAAAAGLKIARKEAWPGYILSAWVGGAADNPEIKHIYNQTLDLLIAECYLNQKPFNFDLAFVKRWVDWMRQEPGLIDKSIFGLSISPIGGPLPTPRQVEEQVRYVRQIAPEMPGMVFFEGGGATPELRTWASRMWEKYFIRPVLIAGGVLGGPPKRPAGGFGDVFIRNIGGMDARNVTVEFWNEGLNTGTKLGQVVVRRIPAGGQASPSLTSVTGRGQRITVRILPSDAYTLLDR